MQLVKWLVVRKRIVLVEVQCRVTSLLRQIVSVVARCTVLIVALARLCPTGQRLCLSEVYIVCDRRALFGDPKSF